MPFSLSGPPPVISECLLDLLDLLFSLLQLSVGLSSELLLLFSDFLLGCSVEVNGVIRLKDVSSNIDVCSGLFHCCFFFRLSLSGFLLICLLLGTYDMFLECFSSA